MIKINLLAVERKAAKKKLAFQLGGQKITLLCTLMLVATALVLAWRYWSLNNQSVRLDQDIASAQAEKAKLQSVITEVSQFEQRKAQLQQRVSLIEQLRRDQTGPVHMLDQISRAMPPMLWLTNLKQGATPSEVVIDGRSTTYTGLSDFVVNLEASGYFKRSVEIVSSQTEPLTTAASAGELIRFSIRAQFQQPGDPVKPAETSPPAARQGE
jgi:type IV pilus assembly protein PilN